MDLRYQKRKFGGLITEHVPLDEERAAKRGGEVLGEAIVVGLGLAVTIHQVQRAAKLEAVEAEKKAVRYEAGRRQQEALFRSSLAQAEARIVTRLGEVEDRVAAQAKAAQEEAQASGWRRAAAAGVVAVAGVALAFRWR